MNYFDLFSGIGGFALGAYWAGWRFDEHYFSEVDDYATRVYQQRFPEAVSLGDITKIVADAEYMRKLQPKRGKQNEWRRTNNASEEWIISGGFPCQDISCAGKGEGIEGRRSGLWFAMRDIIGLLRPRYCIIENVGAITNRGLDVVLATLAEIGYDAEWQDIRASDVGAPHRRERIWIVAYPQRIGRRGRNNGNERRNKGSLQIAGSCAANKCSDVADTEGILLQRQSHRQGERQLGGGGWWGIEPNVGRVAHGIPSRVDRLMGLGNSIVPQIAEMLFRRIKEICNENRNEDR